MVLFLVALSWSRGLLNLRKKGAWKLWPTTGSQHPQPTEPSYHFWGRGIITFNPISGETEAQETEDACGRHVC